MFHKLYKLLTLFLSQFKVYICSRKIMTGDRRAAPSVPGTPTTPGYLLNETTASDGKQSGSHSPKKFMSELHSIQSKLNSWTLSFCFSQTCGQLSMNTLYAYTVMLMTVRVWLGKKRKITLPRRIKHSGSSLFSLLLHILSSKTQYWRIKCTVFLIVPQYQSHISFQQCNAEPVAESHSPIIKYWHFQGFANTDTLSWRLPWPHHGTHFYL